jgi:hypothetical protein
LTSFRHGVSDGEVDVGRGHLPTEIKFNPSSTVNWYITPIEDETFPDRKADFREVRRGTD